MDSDATLTTVDDFEAIPEDELDRVIEYVFAHRKAAVQDFLRARNLTISGTKDELRTRVEEGLADHSITAEDLIGLLDTIEGWGNQHIYLYKSPPGELKDWKNEAKAKQRLADAGFAELFNRRRPLVLPEEPTLSSVEWAKDRVRFVWVEKREWEIRLQDHDKPANRNGVSYKAYQDQIARGVTTFDWNFVSGEAALMIQSLPSGDNYDDIRITFEKQLGAFTKIDGFTKRRIRAAIRKIEKSKEALNRKIELETRRGGTAAYTSKGRKTDAYADPDLKKSRDALGGQTTSKNGNFYFNPKTGFLERPIHVKLYAKDQRVGIFGECNESEVQYVLSRIRHHSP